MAQEKVYPVYLISGFLDSGKTSFINGILADGFAMEDRTLLLQCEEGEVEYDKKLLRNVTVLTVDDQEALTPEFLEAERKKCRASQIIVEYNGMWQIQDFYANAMPQSWVLYQIIATVEGPTFEMYTKNMASLMSEKLRNADMICINRCTGELCHIVRAAHHGEPPGGEVPPVLGRLAHDGPVDHRLKKSYRCKNRAAEDILCGAFFTGSGFTCYPRQACRPRPRQESYRPRSHPQWEPCRPRSRPQRESCTLAVTSTHARSGMSLTSYPMQATARKVISSAQHTMANRPGVKYRPYLAAPASCVPPSVSGTSGS